jgi:hypothetical protein
VRHNLRPRAGAGGDRRSEMRVLLSTYSVGMWE